MIVLDMLLYCKMSCLCNIIVFRSTLYLSPESNRLSSGEATWDLCSWYIKTIVLEIFKYGSHNSDILSKTIHLCVAVSLTDMSHFPVPRNLGKSSGIQNCLLRLQL